MRRIRRSWYAGRIPRLIPRLEFHPALLAQSLELVLLHALLGPRLGLLDALPALHRPDEVSLQRLPARGESVLSDLGRLDLLGFYGGLHEGDGEVPELLR